MKQFFFKDIRLKLLYILLLSITFISITVIKDRFTHQTEIKRGVTYSSKYLTTNGEPLDLNKFDPNKFDRVSILTFYKGESYASVYDRATILTHSLVSFEDESRELFSDKSIMGKEPLAIQLKADPKYRDKFEVISRVKDSKEEDISYYVNLTSQDSFGDEVYLSSYSLGEGQVEELVKLLVDNGYKLENLEPAFFEYIKMIKTDSQSGIYMLITISVFLVYLSALREYIKLNRKKYYIYKLNLAQESVFLRNERDKLVFFAIISVLFFTFLKLTDSTSLSSLEAATILFIIYIATLACLYVNFVLEGKKNE